MRGVVCVGGSIACLLGARASAAQGNVEPEGAWLRWELGPGADGCPDASEMRGAIAGRLGRPGDLPKGVRVHARVQREGARWTAEVEASSGDQATGKRALESRAEGCAAIADAVVLTSVLALEAELAAPREPEPAPEPPKEPPKEELSAPSAPDPEGPPVVVPRGESSIFALRGGAVFGLAPRIGPALELGGRVRLTGRLFASLGLLWVPQRPNFDARFSAGLTAGFGGACFELVRGAVFGVGACANLLGGAVQASSSQPNPMITPGERGWFGVGAGGYATLRISDRWAVEGSASAIVPVTLYEVPNLDCQTPAFSQTNLALYPALGVSRTFF